MKGNTEVKFNCEHESMKGELLQSSEDSSSSVGTRPEDPLEVFLSPFDLCFYDEKKSYFLLVPPHW